MRGRHLYALVALVLLGALLRFATLDARSLWLDEAYTAGLARHNLWDFFSALGHKRHIAAPLYFVLAWFWSKVFGTGEVGLRTLPALFGTATIPVAYAAARELASRRAGLIAAALAAVSPLLVWHSQDARPYSLLILFGGLSFLFFLRALRTGGRRELVGWGIASALTIASHYYGAFVVAPEALVLLSRRRPPVVVWAVAGLFAALALLVPLIAAQKVLSANGFGSSLSSRVVQVPPQFLVGYQPPLQIAASATTAAVALVALWLLVRRGDESERRAAGLAVAIGAAALVAPVLVALVGFDYYLTRYLTGAWIALAAVAAIGFGARRAGRAGIAGASVLCALFLAIDIGSAWEPKFDRDDWRGASKAIGPQMAGRAVVVFPSLGAPAYRYYRPGSERDGPRRVLLREIDLLGLAEPFRQIGKKPLPPRPSVVRTPAIGFAFAGRREYEHFTIVRFRARKPRTVWLPSLRFSSLAGAAAVMLDNPKP